MNIVIGNGKVLTPSNLLADGYVAVSDGRIVSIGEGSVSQAYQSFPFINAEGNFIIPGLIDIHVNGGGGSLAVDGTEEAIRNICAAHARFGTTGLLVTTITVDDQTLRSTISAVVDVCGKQAKDVHGSKILGLHLEGPFLNPKKAGAHKKEFLRLPDKKYLEDLYRLSRGTMRVVSLAPELDGGLDLVDLVRELGMIPSLAHSDADYLTTTKAIEKGMVLCSHLFNAMPPLNHRDPGPIAAFLASEDTYVELIADGYHVHPSVMRVAIKSKGTAEVIIVTDAVTPAGTTMKSFSIMGTRLEVRGNSCFTGEGHLAGSALTMNVAVRTIMEQSAIPMQDAVRMASINPARLLGVEDRKGTIELGKDADLVVVNKSMDVLLTMIEGNVVYRRE